MALIIYFENITQLRVLKCASISLNSLLKRFITDRKPIYGYVLLISNLIDWVLEILNDSNKGNDYDFTFLNTTNDVDLLDGQSQGDIVDVLEVELNFAASNASNDMPFDDGDIHDDFQTNIYIN